MKKLVAVLLLAVASTSAMAQHHGHRNHGHYRGNNWVAPLVIGSVIGFGLSRPYYDNGKHLEIPSPYQPYYAPPPVVYAPPVVYQSNCTRYIYQDQYGQTIREEIRCN